MRADINRHFQCEIRHVNNQVTPEYPLVQSTALKQSCLDRYKIGLMDIE